jgi:predicted DNA-binding protein (UPF0251 family)/DNA-directed RNA polymerase subunit RPC12/RpoP
MNTYILAIEMEIFGMARPVKWRKIENIPDVQQFFPEVEDIEEAGENVLKLEELEAIRLKDLEGLEQSECAERMQVSRPTFQRILISAREKVADSLTNGKAIRIDGGKYTRAIHLVRCLDCGREWNESAENTDRCQDTGYVCPGCSSRKLQCGKTQDRDGQVKWRNCYRGGGRQGQGKRAAARIIAQKKAEQRTDN